MDSKSDQDNPNSKDLNPLESSTLKQDRKPLSNALKYTTAFVIFFGNVTFVSLHNT